MRTTKLIISLAIICTTPLHASRNCSEVFKGGALFARVQALPRVAPVAVRFKSGSEYNSYPKETRRRITDIALVSRPGYNPLHVAVWNYAYLTRFTIDPAMLEEKNLEGRTPLFLAAECWADEALDTLLAKGANPNTTDPNGNTILHSIVRNRYNDEGLLNKVIKAGAHIDHPNVAGFTPLHIAAEMNEKHAMRLLVSNGANVNAITKGGYTPLDFVITHIQYMEKEVSHYSRMDMYERIKGMESILKKNGAISKIYKGIK